MKVQIYSQEGDLKRPFKPSVLAYPENGGVSIKYFG